MSASLAREYNCPHQQMYMVRRLAKDNCRTTPSGKVPWSRNSSCLYGIRGLREKLQTTICNPLRPRLWSRQWCRTAYLDFS